MSDDNLRGRNGMSHDVRSCGEESQRRESGRPANADERAIHLKDEPIAIIGMGCRFPPDLCTPEALWDFLIEGRTAVTDVPEARLEPYRSASPEMAALLRRTTSRGAYLNDVEGFDAGFFGISPREAEVIDPQQRVLLEVTWEALEHAGVPPLGLRGTEAGVFVAGCAFDYAHRMFSDAPRLDAWSVNGAMLFAMANRISYTLDLRGPSMVVDTACAGSLTSLHLACQSLWRHETPLAIAAGAHIIAGPTLTVALDAAQATAPDGMSKAFDKDADGYGRGEGAAVLVLKRLSDAERDGNRVLALIRGSGVFQDGRSEGMMAPNSAAQENMLRRVYERAGMCPSTVDYVETHGTGTPVGDLAEAEALGRVFGEHRTPDQPLMIGSVKPNIGHQEAGAGIAGVIKVVLALRHDRIPRSLFRTLNPDIDWDGLRVRPVGEVTPWTDLGAGRRAGVSSFGFGGTIAHAVIEQAPPTRRSRDDQPATDLGDWPARVFPVSAMSEGGLRAAADKLATWLPAHPWVSQTSVGRTLACGRSHLSGRAAIVAATGEDLARGLAAVAAGDSVSGVCRGSTTAGSTANPVWVFSGHGAQWEGMGRELLRSSPAFAQAIDQLAEVFDQELGLCPREAIISADWSVTAHAQAITFAMQLGLARVWEELGVRPAAIIGHSVGEIAAAVTAGVLDPIEAARFACRRARLLDSVTGHGGMIMVNLPFAEARRRAKAVDGVSAAVAASTSWTVISGTSSVLDDLAVTLRGEGMIVRKVATDVAFHSDHMDPLLDGLRAAAEPLSVSPPRIPLYTTALPDARSTMPRTGDYWAANLRNPVRFAGAVDAAIADGHRLFLEVSAHPVVTHSINEILNDRQVDDGFVGYSLRRHAPERDTLLTNLADLHCHGADVDFTRTHPSAELADLPTAVWQHRPYWLSAPVTGALAGRGHDPATRTLLGTPTLVNGENPLRMWQTHVDFDSRPYPGEHRMFGVEIVPASVMITTLLAADQRGGHPLPELRDVQMLHPITLTSGRAVQVVVQHDGGARICTHVPPADEDRSHEPSWITHVTASLSPAMPFPGTAESVEAVRERCPIQQPWEQARETYHRRGVGGFGFGWQVRTLRRGDDELLAEVGCEVPDNATAGAWASILDAATTLGALLVPDDGVVRMVAFIKSVTVAGEVPADVHLQVKLRPQAAGRGSDCGIDVRIMAPTGAVIGEIRDLRFTEAVAQTEDEPAADDVEAVGSITTRWSGLTGQELLDAVGVDVCEQIAAELRMTADDVTPKRSLAEMGVDSLMIVRLRSRLDRRYGIELPATMMWEQPTVATVARSIAMVIENREAGTPVEDTRRLQPMSVTEMAREAVLGFAIPPQRAEQVSRDNEAILLTGATGFVGAFLLADLLEKHAGEVVCLVRAENQEQARTRLQANLARYGLQPDLSRAVALVGDLSAPRLGLTEKDFTSLGSRLTDIFHAGAKVNWNYPYHALREANVEGTREILRLAFVGRLTPVHFVSTVGVFLSADFEGETVDETEGLDNAGALLMGYTQSKWVSEKLVRNAQAHGLPVTIHRINTGPHSVTGQFNRLDYLSLIVRACVESGMAPDSLPMPPQPAPIDYVTKAITELAADVNAHGGTFHLVNHHPLTWPQIFDHLEAFGYQLVRANFDTWCKTVTENQQAREALGGLEVFLRDVSGHVRMPLFQTGLTRTALNRSGMDCPPVTEELIKTYLERLVSEGTLKTVTSPDE